MSMDERLWSAEIGSSDYAGTKQSYQAAIMEQYKIYVEMADRISARRGQANTFFLSINTAILALVGAAGLRANPWALTFPLVGLLGECVAWFYIVRSYRQLNAAKYEVVGALEKRLPASPYWSAEWLALGEGRDRSKYWPLSHLEQVIPGLFAAVYVGAFTINLIL